MSFKLGHYGDQCAPQESSIEKRDNLAQCWYQHSLFNSKRKAREDEYDSEDPCLDRGTNSPEIHVAFTPALFF